MTTFKVPADKGRREVTQVTPDKSYPVCEGCGHYTCADCGEGFHSREAYLRHRTDPWAHAPEAARA